MGRWKDFEQKALDELKEIVKDEIAKVPPYPDLVGDRKLIRFLRGQNNHVVEAANQYVLFLQWYRENNVEAIRNKILYEGCDHPHKFPLGEKILQLIPQLVIAPYNRDKKGQPIMMESYGFDANAVFDNVAHEDYITFLIHCLEYRALILEQLSDELEKEYLAAHPDPESREDGYGVMLKMCVIQDLKGVGFAHVGAKSRTLIKSSINIASPNYSEYLGKAHIVNVPFVFQALWVFVKGLLEASTVAKVSLSSSSYMATLLQDIPVESIPSKLGGQMEVFNQCFAFDVSPGGPFALLAVEEGSGSGGSGGSGAVGGSEAVDGVSAAVHDLQIVDVVDDADPASSPTNTSDIPSPDGASADDLSSPAQVDSTDGSTSSTEH